MTGGDNADIHQLRSSPYALPFITLQNDDDDNDEIHLNKEVSGVYSLGQQLLAFADWAPGLLGQVSLLMMRMMMLVMMTMMMMIGRRACSGNSTSWSALSCHHDVDDVDDDDYDHDNGHDDDGDNDEVY